MTLANMNDGQELPDRKFITHRHGVKGNNPYGLGLGTRLFWPVLFKREGIAFWMKFLDKFAAPTLLAEVPYGLLPEMQNQLLQSLASWTSSAAMTVPMGTKVGFLEASRSGSVTYEEWARYWDAQMSICVLGETLTTDTQGVGSQALGNVHAQMLDMLVDADGDLLSTTLRQTMLQWLVDYNFPGAKVPQVWRVRASNELANAETDSAKAKAAKEKDEALAQVVARAAMFEKDDQARDYIAQFSPDDLDDQMLDQLVSARFSFAQPVNQQHGQSQLELDGLKKKGLKRDGAPQYDISGNVITAQFADDTDDVDDASDVLKREQASQKQISDRLLALGDAWDKDRVATFKTIIDNAASLEEAAKTTLKVFADLTADAYAEILALAMNAASYAGRDAVLNEAQSDIGVPEFANVEAFNKPFKEQIEFFKQKSPRPTKRWTDILRGDNDRAFIVSGAKDRDMLVDFQNAIADAMTNGTTLETFRKDFDHIVAKYGWTYKGERGWRTKTIFEHNIRSSYMAGRVKQMRDPDVIKMRPYWMYKHGMIRNPKIPRDQHLAWDGLVLRHDDPWWDTHMPPNGWGPCSCGVVTLSQRDLIKRGKDKPDTAPTILMKPQLDKATGKLIEVPQGIDQGWDYMPGDLWERGLVPSQLDTLGARAALSVDAAGPIEDLIKSAKPFKAKTLPTGKEAAFYIDKFLSVFGAARGAATLFTDKAGGHVPISDELFKRADGGSKLFKRGREIYALQLAETLTDPDEIWVGVIDRPIPAEQGGSFEKLIDRKFIRIDPKTGLLVIFEMIKSAWSAKTAFAPMKANSVKTDVNQINKRRSGVLVYKRKE
ncbi:MAG: DUF935 family protein [Ahrensia sp.]|nr:DUF935 family protein [Ahrensia sp.]